MGDGRVDGQRGGRREVWGAKRWAAEGSDSSLSSNGEVQIVFVLLACYDWERGRASREGARAEEWVFQECLWLDVSMHE